MPNYCANVVEIGHADPAKIQELVHAYNKNEFCSYAIPVPPELADTVAGRVGGNEDYAQQLLEFKQQLNLKFFGYATWYDFCVSKWGTKWDCGANSDYNLAEIKEGQTTVTLDFDSAWAPPIGVYEALLDKEFTVRAYYYEPGMGFAGIFTEYGDDYYELSGSADEISEQIPESLDEMFGITENMEEYRDDEAELPTESPLTLASLQQMFPKSNPKHRASTGYIPMGFVEQHLEEIAAVVKEHGLVRVYRGPRNRFRDQSRTWKSDAVAMVLYTK